MPRITVNAQSRTEHKKLKAMVSEGHVPGVVYDQTGSVTSIKIPANEVERLLLTLEGTPLVDILVDGKDKHIALLKEVQKDKRLNRVNHLSFMALDPQKEAVFEVDIEPIGESPAARNNLGVLLITRNSVELRGLPGDIPSKLYADISVLEDVGDLISVGDLSIPETLEFLNENTREFAVASIQPFQKAEEEPAPVTEGEEPAEGEEPVEETDEGVLEGEASPKEGPAEAKPDEK